MIILRKTWKKWSSCIGRFSQIWLEPKYEIQIFDKLFYIYGYAFKTKHKNLAFFFFFFSNFSQLKPVRIFILNFKFLFLVKFPPMEKKVSLAQKARHHFVKVLYQGMLQGILMFPWLIHISNGTSGTKSATNR